MTTPVMNAFTNMSILSAKLTILMALPQFAHYLVQLTEFLALKVPNSLVSKNYHTSDF